MKTAARRSAGFSLLEVLVAVGIMALSLGALYQAAGGSVRSVQRADQRTQALLLAQSLLDAYGTVPPGGLNAAGEEAGLRWQIVSTPYPTAFEQPPGWPLHHVHITVGWGQGGSVSLATLLPANLNDLRLPR
ncbi:PulJ/GspJ family protein [Thauera butanivorans]|uniref:PulJ/GspJ family protein n=1 Tax=Thauera butanivorans TaxID=86174 RepID=UPI003AB72F6F